MKLSLVVVLSLASASAMADCTTSLPLEGNITIPPCDRDTEQCVSASAAAWKYFDGQPDVEADFSIAISASPWHLYDGDMRIMSIEELAASIKDSIHQHERVVLMGSWTGVAPGPTHKSLAVQLSEALDGFPVVGQDGFLWIAKDGSLRTTRQAFTMRRGVGPYEVVNGEEVMISMVAGWPVFLEDRFANDGNADGVMRAAVGQDVFGLCPAGALKSFELAAGMGSAIAAYNAGSIRLALDGAGDRQSAMKMFARAAELGDEKSAEKLQSLQAAEVVGNAR